MNPLTNVKNITKLNETELATGLIHKKSWHDMYKDSAWIFIGGLEYGLTEGDVLAVFSQYGEIENINLVRDKKTGKSKGYCFLCYSNQRSTVLAVDNFNGIKLCNRTIRVDHVSNYKPPKENERDDEITKILKSEGCAPQVAQKLATKETSETKHDDKSERITKKKKTKKEKKEKKKKKRKDKANSSGSEEETPAAEVKIKKEKHDSGYDKYDIPSHKNHSVNKRHHERRTDYSNGECSYSKRNDSLNLNNKHIKTEKCDDVYKTKPRIKIEPESDRECYRTDRKDMSDKDRSKSRTESRKRHDSDVHFTLSIRCKRKMSSPSSSSSDEDETSNYEKNRRHNIDKDEFKRRAKHKKKSKNVETSSSSSSDDASSTQSSSENEKHVERYSRKDKYKTCDESISNRESSSTNRSYKAGDSYTSSKSKHYEKTEKSFEYKSRTKYKDDNRDDSYYKDSHYQKRRSNK